MASVGFANSAMTASAMRVLWSALSAADPRATLATARAALSRKACKSSDIILLPYMNCQPFVLAWSPTTASHVTNGDGHRLLLADQHNQPLAACHSGVEQVPLQHGVVLRQYGDDDGGTGSHTCTFRLRACSRLS